MLGYRFPEIYCMKTESFNSCRVKHELCIVFLLHMHASRLHSVACTFSHYLHLNPDSAGKSRKQFFWYSLSLLKQDRIENKKFASRNDLRDQKRHVIYEKATRVLKIWNFPVSQQTRKRCLDWKEKACCILFSPK